MVKVDNQISTGQFTQTLTCVRLNNQRGEGLPVALISASKKSFEELKKTKDRLQNKQDNIERNKSINVEGLI